MIRMAAVVVLFNPDLDEVERNVRSYLHQVHRLYVVNNSESELKRKTWLNNGTVNKIKYIQNFKNLGIASALNIACRAAIEEGYDWMLTMDQDSFFDKQEIDLYIQQIEEFVSGNENIGILCPSEVKQSELLKFTEAAHRVTSGSCISLLAYKKVNGFDDRLFIDEVDEDYACKVEIAGFRLIGFDNVKMNHQLGVTKKAGFLGVFAKRDRTVHSPFRIYYMVRNYLYIRSKYKSDFPVMFARRDKEFRTMLKNNLIYSSSIWNAFLRALKGYIDFKRNKF